MSPDTHSVSGDNLRHELYEVMDDAELTLEEKKQRALSIGRAYLGVENAHIQRRNDDETDTVVASVGDDPELLPEGDVLDRARTYCRRVVEADGPIALRDAPNEGWADDPAYLEHGLNCYLGTTLFVNGDVYGTVCFASREPRGDDFDAGEKAFVELIARLLGREIESRKHERRLAKTERAHERVANKYSALLTLAPDAIFLADADTGEIVEANQKAVELTGYDAADLEGMQVFDLHPEEERDRYAQLLDSVEAEMRRSEFGDGTPLSLRQADGSDVPVEMSMSKVSIDDEQLVQGIIRDISDRRDRERELARKREFLQQTQETADIGGWEVDFRSKTVRWAEEVYRIHDLPLDYTPTVREALDFYHPEDQPTIKDAFDRLKSEGEPYDLELRIVTADDTVRWVHTVGRPQYDDEGEEVVAARGIFRDITERKERELDLRIKSQAIDELPVGITIGDATQSDNPIVYVNDGFVELTGYSREEVLGENCRFLQGEETDDETTDRIREAIDAEESVRKPILNYRANGTPFWNQLTVSPVTGENSDKVTHFVGIQEDITAQKRRERLIEVLDRVLRHNIRNDMTAVQGFAQEIATQTDGEVAGMARRIVGTAKDLASLTEKTRNFETAVTDSGPLEPRDIVADIRGVVTDLRDAYPDTEFQVTARESQEVMGTEQLTVALRELGDNAARYGESPVTYDVEATEDGYVAIHVQDTGPGMPETERAVLEERRETPLEHGAGLGLWMVNWLVTKVGGDVSVTSDDGTMVTVRLVPATDERASPQQDIALSPHLE